MMNATMTGSAGASAKFGPPTPFIMFQPFNIVSFFGTFSPIILIVLILSYSLFYQNSKGFVYLGFLLASAIVRSIVLQAVGSEKNKEPCGIVRYTDYGNPTFTTFVFAFTLMYLMILSLLMLYLYLHLHLLLFVLIQLILLMFLHCH